MLGKFLYLPNKMFDKLRGDSQTTNGAVYP